MEFDGLEDPPRRNTIVVGLCLGAFVLAAAGLLERRKATTHWGWAEVLRQRWPLTEVQPHVLPPLTGIPLGQWLLTQRLGLAQRLLETTGKSIDVVAHEAGFGTALSLRKHVKKQPQALPRRYREEFCGTIA